MATVLESVCPLDCPDTCSLAVEVEGGRITKVDGSHRNPYTDGFICAKVRQYGKRVYSPLRILRPQRRVGAKGEGQFEPISWDEAIATIAARFREIIARYGAEAIVPYHYGGSNGVFSEDGADARFFHLLGASQLKKTLCAAPTGTATRALYGAMGGVPPQDYSRARFILLWGVNPSATSVHLSAELRAARKAGAFIAVIDPRRTKTATSADLHLAPRPGTDVVLALAIANHLICGSRTDRQFIAEWVNGFDAFAAAAARYPLAEAERICGVSAAQIAALAERYAEATPAVVRCGWGVERNQNGGNAVRAILALPAIAGKFRVRGGGYTMSLSRRFPIDAAALGRPDLLERPVRSINMTQIGRLLQERLDPPIAGLFVYNANPVAMTPNQNEVIKGLAREDLFTVVHEQVMTDTAALADIVLPATTVFEQRELHKSYGHYYLQYSEPVIAPLGESLTNAQLFGRLAAALELGSPDLFAEEDLLRAALARAGATRAELTPAEVQRTRLVPIHFDRGEELIQFVTEFPKTPSGKVELQPDGFGAIQFQPQEPSRYPLALISPSTGKTINSIFGEFNLPRAYLEMHPHDAGARGIADGADVRIHNELGEVHVPVKLTTTIRPGVVALPKGLWRGSTLNGSTATALAPDHLSDYGDGACYNDARVEVAPLAH